MMMYDDLLQISFHHFVLNYQSFVILALLIFFHHEMSIAFFQSFILTTIAMVSMDFLIEANTIQTINYFSIDLKQEYGDQMSIKMKMMAICLAVMNLLNFPFAFLYFNSCMLLLLDSCFLLNSLMFDKLISSLVQLVTIFTIVSSTTSLIVSQAKSQHTASQLYLSYNKKKSQL